MTPTRFPLPVLGSEPSTAAAEPSAPALVDLPDYVYFNHSIHVNKGVGCVTCHGRVDEMAAVNQKSPMTMGWCVDCHRNPELQLRPVEFMTSMTWRPDPGVDRAALGTQLAKQYNVHTRVACDTCHR